MIIKRKLVILLLGLIYCNLNIAQRDEYKIDQIFSAVNNSSKPGVAACLMHDGEVLYSKGFGSKNIATGQRISPQTQFQLGELSKQFTTLAILLLERSGKISMDDNIRKYVPELPPYTQDIKVRHLINHTSGLHDIRRLNYLINGSMDIVSQKKALQLIASQKELTSRPGEEFSFHESITESVLMAEIVSRASGQSFADFVQSQIFQPLCMKNSLIRDDANAILQGAALPYQYDEDKKTYLRNPVTSSVVGAINGYSTIEDLAIWYSNYDNPTDSIGFLIQSLDRSVRTNDGDHFEYYWGKMAIGREFTHPERGLPIFWNYGLQGGYGTNVFRYLDQGYTSIVLGNNNQYNGGTAHEMIDLFVEDSYTLPANIDFDKKNIKNLDIEQLKKVEGNYWFPEGYASELFVKNDTLRSKWLFGNSYQTLVPLSTNTFQQYAKMEDTRLFNFKEEDNNMVLHFSYNESPPDIMYRYTPVTPSPSELASIAGIYFNEDYGSLFHFDMEDGELVAHNLHHDSIKLQPVMQDVYTSTSLFFNAITLIRDDSDIVRGFSICTDGIRHLEFEKVGTQQIRQ